MEDETVRMSWLSGRPQRVLTLRPPADFPSGYDAHIMKWSVMDDQIFCTFEPGARGAEIPSSVYLVDIKESLGRDADVVEFKKIVTLPFYAAKSRLLSHRKGFVTAEFRENYPAKFVFSESKLILRTHDWAGNISRETTTHAGSIDGNLVVHDSSIALCVDDEPKRGKCIGHCRNLSQIVIWNTESGDLTRIDIPRDERAPQCHSGNFQFITPSSIAIGGHIDPCYNKPYAVLRSVSTVPSEENHGRYFHHHENFEFGDNNDAIAIPGSSASSDIIVHHHHSNNRFTVANVGLLTGEIPSETLPTPGYFINPNLFKDLFHVFSDKFSARTLKGSLYDRFSSLAGNKLLVRELIEEYGHDQEKWRGFTAKGFLGTFQILYLYDFDQDRCKALRQLSPGPERDNLEARLKERNPDARVTVVSRMYYTSIEDDFDMEKDASPEWEAHVRKLWEIQQEREEGDGEFPVLEYDDPPEGQDDPRMLFTRSMICLPKMRDGEKIALTTSAIVEFPTYNADGYIFYFGEE
ncbi:hypothetical protein ACHAQJ_008507 [Trichoderma viride]